MRARSLTDDLSESLCRLDELAERHREAQAHQVARERLAFLHELLQALEAELTELHAACEALQGRRVDSSWEDIWRDTCLELQRYAPELFASPGPSKALIAANADLLRLVANASMALTLARERRRQLSTLDGRPLGSRPSGRQAAGDVVANQAVPPVEIETLPGVTHLPDDA